MNLIKIDPRGSVINQRFSKIKRIISVTGFKGGIGKSVISVMLSLAFAEKGFKTGLLDLDLSGATCHILLGAKHFPKEEKGLIPPCIHRVKFMTAAYFANNKALALRGNSISNAIKELLTVTIWDELDFLIIDMPPGINDTALDVIRLIERTEILAICIPSKLSDEILRKSLEIYKTLGIKIIGVIENMAIVKKKNFYSQIFYDAKFEKSIGMPKKMLKTNLYEDILKLAEKIVCKNNVKNVKI